MPRKNGAECLEEIKLNENLKELPIVIYSTSLHETITDDLYEKGAHYYMRKTDFKELEKELQNILTLLVENKFERPPRNKFVLNTVEAKHQNSSR